MNATDSRPEPGTARFTNRCTACLEDDAVFTVRNADELIALWHNATPACDECTMPVDFDPNDSQIGGHAPHWAASRARDIAHRNTTEDET